MMGSGKTSVAQELQSILEDYSLVDIDSVITELEGRSINEIFNTNGEDYFRQIEKLIIKSYEDFSKKIISTGGGAFKNAENITSLKKNGVVFYLSAPAEELYERIKSDNTRPLLQTENPKSTIESLLNEREKNYKLADYEIETKNKTINEIAKEIIKKYNDKSESFITVRTPAKGENEYPIIIGENIIKSAQNYINRHSGANKYLIVTNNTINDILGEKLKIENSEKLILPDGEEFKNFDTLQKIIDKAIEIKLERKDAIIAFGGGVIGDMAGFAAATYQRGIDFIQIPTTLLAQVDSSVGGKVAINHKEGKNLIGNFYQPKVVLADTSVLKTLDKRQLKTGLAEVVKYAFIEKTCNSQEFFNFYDFLKEKKELLLNSDINTLAQVVEICCRLKSAVVYQDENEKGLRAILNFGHTFAHAIEKVTNYKTYTHGEAVAIGMKMAFNLSAKMKLIEESYKNESIDLIKSYNLIQKLDINIQLDTVMAAMKLDKKVQSSKVRFVLPVGQGSVEIFDNIDENLIKEVVQQEL